MIPSSPKGFAGRSLRRALAAVVVAALLWLGAAGAAFAQASVAMWCWNPTGSSATNNQYQPCNAANPLVVSATVSPSGTQNVNLTQILGAAPSLTNPLWVFPATGATFPISGTLSVAGNSGNVTQSTVSVTNASTTMAAAAAFTNFAKICVALGASTGVWVNWAGAAAVTAAPSEYIPPGQCDSWVKSSGYLPTQQWNAISNSASTIAVSLIGN